MKLRRNNVVLPDDMDIDCICLCELLNMLPETYTVESCCGHQHKSFCVWFHCGSIEVLSRLGRAVERNYSDGKWEIIVDSSDTNPYGLFCLRSKVVFIYKTWMIFSRDSLIDNIKYWFGDEHDDHFKKRRKWTRI